MYTRCPACQASYELRAGLLSEAAGVVRCGNCGKTFNSLSQLFEQHPGDDDEPLRGGGMPPLLEHPDMVQAELPVEHFDEPADEPDETLFFPGGEAQDPGPIARWLWPLASGTLLILLCVQTWVQWQTPGSPVARWLGSSAQPDAAIDPDSAIQIVSRDMHRHPSIDDAVVVSASLRNQVDTAVPFPVIEVRFYDASQQVLGIRRLAPDDYLRDDDRIESGLQPGSIMPVLLEFVVGTTEPAGFQMRFH